MCGDAQTMTKEETVRWAGQLRMALEDITRAYREIADATAHEWDARPRGNGPVYTHARDLLRQCPDEIEPVV